MNRGFSLFEVLVAIAVFSVAVLSAVGSLVVVMSSQKKAFFVQTNQDNVRFSIEALEREIRTGVGYQQATGYCSTPGGPSDPRGESCFQFVNAQDQQIIYKWSSDSLVCFSSNAQCIAKSTDGAAFEPITAPEVNVEVLKFVLTGENIDNFQPRVTLIIRAVTPAVEPRQSRLDVQTTISKLKTDI